MVFICGIDEAGRGPIIGPMVMCGVLIDEKDEVLLKKIDVKDSKLLSREERDELYPKILGIVKKYKISIISQQEIDKAVNGHDGLNLNWLEAANTAKILNELEPDAAIVDSPSPNLINYKNYVAKKLNKKIQLKFEHKADLNYPVVAAASILAKVTRDKEIEKLKKEIGIDFGSGYMSDPKTSEFLKNHYETHKDLFRKSWFPYQDLVNKKFQKSLTDFTQFLKEAQETPSVSGPQKSKGFFRKKKHDHTIDDLKKLEDHGFHFETPRSEHELVIMKGTCTVILYKNGNLLVQGSEEDTKPIKKLLGI